MSKKVTEALADVRFRVGDKVRVRHGIMDVEYSDLPIGGWAGTVTENHGEGMCTVEWSKETLALIHPVYQKRCERDGLDIANFWLSADDLEPDSGGPLDIEQPKQIVVRPLSPNDQDDRIRLVFGLTSDDPLPDVDEESLATYHAYLSQKLEFPFVAEYRGRRGPAERVKVIRLNNPDDDLMIDDEYGILCQARLEGHAITRPLCDLDDAKPNRQLIADYGYWFGNFA